MFELLLMLGLALALGLRLGSGSGLEFLLALVLFSAVGAGVHGAAHADGWPVRHGRGHPAHVSRDLEQCNPQYANRPFYLLTYREPPPLV